MESKFKTFVVKTGDDILEIEADEFYVTFEHLHFIKNKDVVAYFKSWDCVYEISSCRNIFCMEK